MRATLEVRKSHIHFKTISYIGRQVRAMLEMVKSGYDLMNYIISISCWIKRVKSDLTACDKDCIIFPRKTRF